MSKIIYRKYELTGNADYIDYYCIELDPYPVDRTNREKAEMSCLCHKAVSQFDANRIGIYGVCFKLNKDREKFLTWVILSGHTLHEVLEQR